MNKELPNSIVLSKAYLILCTYLLVFLVCTLALFWVDSSKIGVVLLFAFSLVFTIYILQHRSDKVQFLPIVILMIYLLSFIFFFEFGPYSYPVKNKNLLYFYLGGVHLALFMGYIKGIKVRMLDHIRKYKVKEILNFFMIGSALYLLVNLPFFISSIPNIFSVIHGNVSTVRNAYLMRGGQWKDYISIFLFFFNNTFLILTIYYWESTNFLVRCFFIIDFIFNLLSSIAIAGRSGTFGALILITFSFIAAYFSENLKKSVYKFLLISSLLFAFFLLYSNFIALTRTPDSTFAVQSTIPGVELNKDSILFRVIPKFFQPLTFTGIQYFSGGYYGLSLCLEKPFVGIAFGAGQSIFLTRNFARFFNFDYIYHLSYPFRLLLEDNFPPSIWVTAYPWIASDVTFIGSIFVLFILGYLLALAWKDVLIKHNPFAVVAFVTLSTAIIFLPMGSATQAGSEFVNFYTVLIVWWVTRTRLVQRKAQRELGFNI